MLAGAGNAFGLIGFYKAAELGPLSVVAPIGAAGAVVPVVWGSPGDTLHAIQVVGVVLALGGGALARASRRPRTPRGRLPRSARKRAMGGGRRSPSASS